MSEKAKQLAEAHAGYIESLLEAHGEDKEVIEKILFHYKTSFIHGFKHGQEELLEEQKRDDSFMNSLSRSGV